MIHITFQGLIFDLNIDFISISDDIANRSFQVKGINRISKCEFMDSRPNSSKSGLIKKTFAPFLFNPEALYPDGTVKVKNKGFRSDNPSKKRAVSWEKIAFLNFVCRISISSKKISSEVYNPLETLFISPLSKSKVM